MAGRNHIPPPSHSNHGDIHIQRSVPHPQVILVEDHRLRRAQPQSSLHSGARHHTDERIEADKREFQTLLLDNQQLIANHVALKQDLALAQQELRKLATVAGNVKAERDADVREVYELSMKMEADVRSSEGMKLELDQVRADVEKLTGSKEELAERLKVIEEDSVKAKAELKDVEVIKAEIEAMRRELQKGRAAVEFEKKTHATNAEQRKAMEKHIISTRHELDKLRTDLDNAEKRARAATAAAATTNPNPGYVASSFGFPDAGYGGGVYPAQYGMHQAHGTAPPQYGPAGYAHPQYGAAGHLPPQYGSVGHAPPQYGSVAHVPPPPYPQYGPVGHAPPPPPLEYGATAIVQDEYNMQQPQGPG